MVTITCKIPEALDAKLETVANQRGVSKSKLVRESIQQALAQERKIKISAYDVMQGACGILKRGPRDLATNPQHMKGFGRER